MPNIEIHGMDKKAAEDLRAKIFRELREEPYLKETVVSILPSIVEDSERNDRPFLRLIDDTGIVVEKLDSFGLDVEYLKLGFFYTKDYLEGGKK